MPYPASGWYLRSRVEQWLPPVHGSYRGTRLPLLEPAIVIGTR